MTRLMRRTLVVALAFLATAGSAAATPRAFEGGSAGALGATDFADWTTADDTANTATGTIHGSAVTLTGSDLQPGSTLNGTFTGFGAEYFTPPLEMSDALTIGTFTGYSYELSLAAPVTDPVLHLASLASTLTFPPGTAVAKVSGQPTLLVSGSTVSGAAEGSGQNSDANGTVQITGTFTTLSFTAEPVPEAPNGDQFYLQMGAAPPPGPSPTPEPTPTATPSPAAPQNLTAPEIRPAAATGTYTCDPGTWSGAGSFTYRWLVFRTEAGESIAETQELQPDPSVYGYQVACQATADGAVTATSPRVTFSSGGLNELPPAYGDVRIRGIDVFQVVQPSTGSLMFGYPTRTSFLTFCGAGTPSAWFDEFDPSLVGANCQLRGRDPQLANYEGVVLDRLKQTWAVVYVDVAGADPADPALRFPLELSATTNGGASLGDPMVRRVRNPPRADTPWVERLERDSVSGDDSQRHGIAFRMPTAWQAGGAIRLNARLRFPDPLQYGTARYGLHQCDIGDCSLNDAYTLHDIPFADLPDLRVSTLELRRTVDGQGALTDPREVLETARGLFPGGDRFVVTPYRATLDIDPHNTCTDAGVRVCRQRHVQGVIQDWMSDNPARPRVVFTAAGRRQYDVVMGVHNYFTGEAGALEPGWAGPATDSGWRSILDVGRLEPRSSTATPYFTAIDDRRPLTAAAHELGHYLTGRHAGANCNSGGPESWQPDERGRLQGVKWTEPFLGLGRTPGSGGAQVDGNDDKQLFDLMSYCSGEDAAWLSARNWNRYSYELAAFRRRLDSRPTRTAELTQAAAAGQSYAVGSAGPDGGRIDRVVAPDGNDAVPAPVPGADHVLRSLAGDGRVLLEAGIELLGNTEVSAPGGTFTGPVAADAEVVELVRSGTVLHRLERSRPPSVELTAPRRGTRVRSGGALEARWRASDPDGDVITATVEYSVDGGRTWIGVHSGASRGSTAIPAGMLAYSRKARVRVIVSDGFAEGSATSPPFSSPGTRPQVRIDTPEAGAVIRRGERVGLAGGASDDLNTPITGRRLVWFADSRRLGTGERLTRALPAGTRRVRLVARDRAGRTAAATLRVQVEKPPLRLLQLAVPARVGRGARSVVVRVRASARATLRAGRRRQSVRPKLTRVTVRLPRRPAVGVVSIPFKLSSRAAAGTVRGQISVLRTGTGRATTADSTSSLP